MIRTSNVVRPLLALSAALMAAPLAAQEPVTVTGEPVFQESVSFADLDLRSESAQQKLKSRVHRAADRVCEQAEGPFAANKYGIGFAPTCAELTYREAKPQIRDAIEGARSGQLAVASLAVSAPRVR